MFILKCICHSFDLVASDACKKIPSDAELLVRLVHSYTHCSFKRLSEFRAFQIFFDLKREKMLHPNQTRWLSVLPAIIRVRDQYLALKLYFIGEQLNPKNDEKSAASAIHLLLMNPINKLYLDFLSHVIPCFMHLNKEFQSGTNKIHLLYWKISQVYRKILDCYIKGDVLNSQGLNCIHYRNSCNFVKLEDRFRSWLQPRPDVFVRVSLFSGGSILAFLWLYGSQYCFILAEWLACAS